jgi:Peptidase_C39 like family
MNHRHLRTRFRHAAPRRSRKIPVMSAAAIGLASVVAVSVSQSVGAASTGHTSRAAVLDLSGAQAAFGGTSAAKSSGTKGATAQPSAAASASAAAAAPSAPAQAELPYEFQLQTTFYYCGPAATRIAATVRGLVPSQDDTATALGTTVNGTNSAFDVARVLNHVTGTSFYHATSIPDQAATPAQMDQLQADVVHAVSNGYAVVANIIGTAWDTNGVAHSYDGGHYLTVVGYQDQGRLVKIADPANVVGDGTYWMTTINLADWAATRGYAS